MFQEMRNFHPYKVFCSTTCLIVIVHVLDATCYIPLGLRRSFFLCRVGQKCCSLFCHPLLEILVALLQHRVHLCSFSPKQKKSAIHLSWTNSCYSSGNWGRTFCLLYASNMRSSIYPGKSLNLLSVSTPVHFLLREANHCFLLFLCIASCDIHAILVGAVPP